MWPGYIKVGYRPFSEVQRKLLYVFNVLRVQTVDATHALNLSAGVSYSNVFLGRSFKRRATAFSLA